MPLCPCLLSARFARCFRTRTSRWWRVRAADLYAREPAIDRVIPYTAQKGLGAKREFAARLRGQRFDGAILLQNAFDAALMAWLAGIPERIGYNRDARGFLLTQRIVPEPGEIPAARAILLPVNFCAAPE